MKRILVFIACIVLMCAMPLAVFAEETETIPVEETVPIEETVPETTPAETTPEPPESEPSPLDQAKTITDKIVAWVVERLDTISCVITIVLTTFYQIRKHGLLNKSIGTLNNNAVTVAESSNAAIAVALAEVKNVSEKVNDYKTEIANLLTEVRANAEEKQKLVQALEDVYNHLKTAKLANVELANEVAELLVLANIPNSKKDELYARHLAAVSAISDAEKAVATEVKEAKEDDDGEEA